MLFNKTSHKFTGKLGQKVDKTKCGYIYKIILSKIYWNLKGGQQSPVLRTGSAVKRPPMDGLTSNKVLGGK